MRLLQHDTRADLTSRWLMLTRQTLPSMAADLDTALGCRWDRVVRRPAIRNMTDAQLAAAVQVAESIAREPGLLAGLNKASLQLRKSA